MWRAVVVQAHTVSLGYLRLNFSCLPYEKHLINHRRAGTFGLGGAVTFLPEKNCKMPERVGVEIGMQTETFTIFPSKETATMGKIAQLKVCRLNSINCLNFL